MISNILEQVEVEADMEELIERLAALSEAFEKSGDAKRAAEIELAIACMYNASLLVRGDSKREG